MSSQDQELWSKLTIRSFDPVGDLDDFMVWASDERVPKYCFWDAVKSKEEAVEYINQNVINHPYYKVICLNNRAIGVISLQFNGGNDRCRCGVGYALGSRYWGKGIAAWAVKTLVSTTFEERPELERIEAFVDVENIGSMKVLEKVGFTREGVLRKYFIVKRRTRDMVLFSFLRTDIPQRGRG
ncbi:uncharacterized protein LOC141657318 [Silene latifolia]|uniref:uncharacterized protein LOC141657318 n=1 Tax=Silene latifolia TaxID=37657 RepID=UPI003D782D1E